MPLCLSTCCNWSAWRLWMNVLRASVANVSNEDKEWGRLRANEGRFFLRKLFLRKLFLRKLFLLFLLFLFLFFLLFLLLLLWLWLLLRLLLLHCSWDGGFLFRSALPLAGGRGRRIYKYSWWLNHYYSWPIPGMFSHMPGNHLKCLLKTLNSSFFLISNFFP